MHVDGSWIQRRQQPPAYCCEMCVKFTYKSGLLP